MTTINETTNGDAKFSLSRMARAKGAPVNPLNWGQPGELTDEEVNVYVSSSHLVDLVFPARIFEYRFFYYHKSCVRLTF